ncbi:hypothetical protein [Salinimicrobium xinjiangense]|uniref:hypothetical protein n=1 Tax=Salinimicrobium xinjiangense TaxID=438596 RepID=UPI00041FF3C9|nr:hypothetical protein [Salinimicrobium xinjiangense]
MRIWNFQVSSDPVEVSRRLESAFGGTKRFVFRVNSEKKKPVKFKIRKRMLLGFEINTQNNLIVTGKLFKVDSEDKTDVKIAFMLHPLSKVLLFGHLILGLGLLAGMVLEYSSNAYMWIIGGILLATGLLIGLHLKKEVEKQVQEYKILISGILEYSPAEA